MKNQNICPLVNHVTPSMRGCQYQIVAENFSHTACSTLDDGAEDCNDDEGVVGALSSSGVTACVRARAPITSASCSKAVSSLMAAPRNRAVGCTRPCFC